MPSLQMFGLIFGVYRLLIASNRGCRHGVCCFSVFFSKEEREKGERMCVSQRVTCVSCMIDERKFRL